MSNKNNGMIAKIWGPPGWLFLHCITMGYPEFIENNPKKSKYKEHQERKKSTQKFFILLGDVLPCGACRKSYKKFIKMHPIHYHLNSRQDLARWFYDIHNLINDKLDVPNEDRPKNFNEFYNRYEKFRSTCGEKKCEKPTDGIAKKSVIKIIDKNGKDYCINTSEDTKDSDILTHYNETNDYNLLHLLSNTAKMLLKQSAIFSIENNQGDVDKAKEIVKNI
tara:strand:- start:1928 stop:2590 length:663 start_codon:yes stop_codon:yes gene_type:complete